MKIGNNNFDCQFSIGLGFVNGMDSPSRPTAPKLVIRHNPSVADRDIICGKRSRHITKMTKKLGASIFQCNC